MKRPLIFLWVVSIAATLAGMPYAFELQKDVVAKAPVPFPILILVALVQTALLLAIAIYAGSKLAKYIGLSTLTFEKIKGGAIARWGITTGVITGAIIYALDQYFLAYYTPQLSVGTVGVTTWKMLLAPFYGGVVEEVLMRLFLMSFIAWILAKLFKVERPVENKMIMWSAISVAAIVFGLGHLPATAAITAITPAVFVRAILLNGVGGMVFGWLYWKKGLEYSIVAHFTTDVVLIVLLPMLMA